jgi:hypothetical protein
MRRRRARNEGGFVTAQAVLVYAFSLMTLVWLANFVVYQYGRGAVRAAIDEGARAGTRVDASAAACQARAQEALDGLFGGAMGRGITVSCIDTGDKVLARATGTFTSWMAPVPDYTFSVTAVALRSKAPS